MKFLRYIEFIGIIKKIILIITIILVLYLPLRFILDDFARRPQAYMQTNISTEIQKQLIQEFETLQALPLNSSIDKVVMRPQDFQPTDIIIYCTVPTNKSDFFQYAKDDKFISANQESEKVIFRFECDVLPKLGDIGRTTWLKSGEKLPITYTSPPQTPKIIGILIVINFPLRIFLHIMKKVLTNKIKKNAL